MRSNVYQYANPDENLKIALTSAFESMPLSCEQAEYLTNAILRLIINRTKQGSHYDNNPTHAEHLDKLATYIDSLKATRKALLALPLLSQEILAEMNAELDCTLLDKQAVGTLFCPMYDDKSNLPEWRLNGLSNNERWGVELELIDLMSACAMHWRDNYLSKHKRRDSTHIGMIANIARLCQENGIIISHTPRSHFMKIMMLVFPNLSAPRDAIRQAAKLLAK